MNYCIKINSYEQKNAEFWFCCISLKNEVKIYSNVNLFYLLTARCRVLLEKLTGLKLVKKFPAFHGTQRFITALTSVRHLSLSWASPIQSTCPHPTSWRSILILSTHLRLGPPWSLSLRFPHQDPIHPPLLTHTHHMSSHPILLDFITRTILGKYRSFNSSLCNPLHSPVTSSLIGSNILLNTIFSNTLSSFPPSMSATKFHTHREKLIEFRIANPWSRKVEYVNQAHSPLIFSN